MKVEEANKIIAEYIHPDKILREQVELICEESPLKYSKSLDALVPVWEKLNCYLDHDKELDTNKIIIKLSSHLFANYIVIGKGETIQEAACLATAKAIKELEE